MTHTFKPTTVAIGDLVAHPANVRTNSPETYASENIANLKASIAVLGLLQPLLVQKIDGKYGLLAGGRRHAALIELVADKTVKGFTNRTKIDCRLVPDDCDVTTALSLATGVRAQGSMHPDHGFPAGCDITATGACAPTYAALQSAGDRPASELHHCPVDHFFQDSKKEEEISTCRSFHATTSPLKTILTHF